MPSADQTPKPLRKTRRKGPPRRAKPAAEAVAAVAKPSATRAALNRGADRQEQQRLCEVVCRIGRRNACRSADRGGHAGAVYALALEGMRLRSRSQQLCEDCPAKLQCPALGTWTAAVSERVRGARRPMPRLKQQRDAELV